MIEYEKCEVKDAIAFKLKDRIFLRDEFQKSTQYVSVTEPHISLRMELDRWSEFYVKDFYILGIVPLKEKVKVPLEFEASIQKPVQVIFRKNDAYQNLLVLVPTQTIQDDVIIGRKFKCVEILDGK